MKKKHIIFMIGIMVSLAACGKNTNEMNKSQELDKYLLLEGMLNERMNKAIETMNEEVGEEE